MANGHEDRDDHDVMITIMLMIVVMRMLTMMMVMKNRMIIKIMLCVDDKDNCSINHYSNGCDYGDGEEDGDDGNEHSDC